MRVSVASIVIVSLLLGCCHAAPTEEEEETISYKGFQLWSAIPSSDEEREFLLKLKEDYDLELWKATRSANDPMDFLIPPQFQSELKKRFKEADISFKTTIEDLQVAINNENPQVNQTDEGDDRQYHKMDWNSYHRLDDIYGYLDYLANTFPRNVEVTSIGSSSEGRALKVVRISSGSSSSKPAVWIDGGIHAREWISPAVATYLIQQLVEGPDGVELTKDVDWYIMPVMNPDGYEHTHTGNRLWRKTRTQRGFRCRGADPNRNFGYKWGGKGTSQDQCSEIYAGASPFSEPETRAVSNFIQGRANRIKVYLTLHSYGQYFLIPWGYDVAYPSDYNDMKAVANKAAATFRRYRYTVGNSAELLYPAAGGSDDWAKSIGIKYSYTIELADTGSNGFILPASQIQPVCEDFLPAMKVFADTATSG